MGTFNGNESSEYFLAYEESLLGFGLIGKWKSWEINGGGGNDTLAGGPKSDSLDGWTGDDNLYGKAGNDTLLGWDGNDYLNGGDDHDSLYGESGNDTLDGWTGNDYLSGGSGDDKLLGWTGDDFVTGGFGSDSLLGEAGNDILDGGGTGYDSQQYDTLYGGTGNDTFVLGGYGTNNYRGLGYATIDDFSYVTGNTDKIQIGASVSVDRVFNSSTQQWGSYIYNGSSNDLIGVVKGVDLISSDFVKPSTATVSFI